MAKKYQIQIATEWAQTQGAFRGLLDLMGKADAAGVKFGRTLDGIFSHSDPAVRKFNGDVGQTSTLFAHAGQNAGRFGQQAAQAADRAAQAFRGMAAQATAATKAAKGEQVKIDIGGYKFIAEDLKRRTKAEQKAHADRLKYERENIHSIESLHRSALTARSKRIEQQRKEEEGIQKRWVQWERENVHSVEGLHYAALSARSKKIAEKQKEDEEIGKRWVQWERENVHAVEDLHFAAMSARSRRIEQQRKEEEEAGKRKVQWERENVHTIEALHRAALDARSRRIEQQRKEEEESAKKKIKWERDNVHTVDALQESALHAKSKRIEREQREEDAFQRGFLKNISEREIKQAVANEKMRQSNEKRVQSAMRANGLEKQGIDKFIDSMGMMIARFAVYHMVIGKATQAITMYGQALKNARSEQDRMLDKFTDERAGLDRLSAQLGRPNDNNLYRDVKMFAADTGMTFGEASGFQLNVAESASQYISQKGENEAQQQQRGRTVTPEQYQKILKKAAVFARQRGMTDEQAQKMLGTVIGSEDVRGQGDKGVDRMLEKFARPSLILEHGLGPTPVLQGQLAEFHGEFGHGFKSMDDEAIFLSTIAQGRPSGHVHAAGRALIQEIESPTKKTQPFLQKVKMANGKPMMHGDQFSGDYTAQEKIEAIQKHLDSMNLNDQQREALIRRTFGVKTGLSAAVQVFGSRAGAVREERQDFADRHGTPAAIQAEMALRDNTQAADLRRRQAATELAESERTAPDAQIKNLMEMGKGQLQKEGYLYSTKDYLKRGQIEAMSGGMADTSDNMVFMLKAQRMLMDETDKVAPGKLKNYQMFNPMQSTEYGKQQLLKLKGLRDQAVQGANPGAKPLVPQASIGPRGKDVEGQQLAILKDIKTSIDKQTDAMKGHGHGEAMAAHGPSMPLMSMPGVQIGMG